jgi:hypothetical protein
MFLGIGIGYEHPPIPDIDYPALKYEGIDAGGDAMIDADGNTMIFPE